MKITVVSPHSGDAALALGLAIEGWLLRGHAVEVICCFTRSEFAPYSDAGSLHANDRMSFVTAVRRREEETWRRRFGGSKLVVTDLNLKDAPLRLHCSREDAFGRPADVSEKVVTKIRRAVEQSKGGALVLPLGLSGHVDYVSARNAAMHAQTVMLPLAFYAEFPFAARMEGDRALNDAAGQLPAELQAELQSVDADLLAQASVDEAVQRKRRIALCYDSQMNDAVTTEIAESIRRSNGVERILANAAWRGNAVLMQSGE